MRKPSVGAVIICRRRAPGGQRKRSDWLTHSHRYNTSNGGIWTSIMAGLFYLLKFAILVALALSAALANAGTKAQMAFTFVNKDRLHIIASGPIDLETPTIFTALMASIRRVRGTADSRAIRAYGFTTVVSDGKECDSACAIAFLGGISRYVSGGGKLGVHQFASQPAIEHPDSPQFTGKDAIVDQDLVGQLLDYVKEMGVGADVVAIASRTPPSAVHWLTKEEIVSTNCAKVSNKPLLDQSTVSSPRPPEISGPSSPSPPPIPAPDGGAGGTTLPAAAHSALLVATADNPQKPAVSLSTVWSVIPAAPGQPATVAVRAEADIPDFKMRATMTLRKNTDPTLQATHMIDLKFSFVMAPRSPASRTSACRRCGLRIRPPLKR